MDISEIIISRRSHFVKEFTGEIVPDSVVQKMMENSRWAPSHKLTFPWRFTVFSGNEKILLCSAMEKYYKEFTPADKFDAAKLRKIETYATKVSHIISIGMHPSGLVPEWEELAATAMAVQNMYLTLTSEPHAAGYWTTGNGTGSDFMKEFVGLLPDDKHLGFFMLGWVTEKRFKANR